MSDSPAKHRPVLRVLIADDQPDIADLIAELLQLSLPCEVTVAYDGPTALELGLRTPFDAVVLDLYMPGMDGIAVAARIREACQPPPCLIALTGEPGAARRLPAIDANFHRVFAKPLDTDQLIAALARLMAEPARAAATLNLAELFTRAARQVVPVAVSRGLAFSFDHEGPSVLVEGDAVDVQCGLHRLLLGAVDMLANGFVMFRAHVSLSPSGDCAVVVDAAGVGDLQSPEVISSVLARLALSEPPELPGELPGPLRMASGTCPNTGAPISFSSQPKDGLLLRAVLTYARAEQDAASHAAPVGQACAWLVDASEQPSAWLHRRLQRLGWRVCRFDSLAQARQQRLAPPEAGEPACEPPLLLVVVEGPGIDVAEATALQRALPPATHCVLAAMAGSAALGTPGSVPYYEVSVYPFSPRELAEFSLLARPAGGVDGAGSPPAGRHQGLEDRPVVLLVDDNEINRIVGRSLVEALGYEVRTANDGLDAIDHCRQAPPRVVLMDLDMPVLSGLEASRRLRELQRRGEVAPFAIVAATADASPAAREACERAGMDAYMTKPFTIEALQSQLRRFTAAV